MLKPHECNNCPINKFSYGFSKPLGQGNLGVTIVGDHLDERGIDTGLPFDSKGQSGNILDWAISSLQTTKQQYNLTLLNQCSPYTNILYSFPEAYSYCYQQHTKQRIFRYGHKVILALGSEPTYRLTQWSGVEEDKTTIEYVRGYPTKFLENGKESDVWVVPTYDPKFIQSGKLPYVEYLKRDLRLALRIAQGKFIPQSTEEYLKQKDYRVATVEDLQSYYYFLKDNPNLIIVEDTETPNIGTIDEETRAKQDRNNIRILQMQFSHRKDFGITFPYTEGHAKWAKKIMALPNVKVGHNSYSFDYNVLNLNGFTINGQKIDTMWLVKHAMPQIDLNLQSCATWANFQFPWKHFFGENDELYCCADADSNYYVWEWFEKHYDKARPKIEITCNGLPSKNHAPLQRTLKDGFAYHVKGYYEMALRPASLVGLPVHKEGYKMLANDLLNQINTLYAELQSLVPPEVKPSKQANGLKRTPKEVIAALKQYADGKGQGKLEEEYVLETTGYELRWFDDKKTMKKELRWCKVNEFKPSSQAVKRYISWKVKQLKTRVEKQNYKLPVNRKSKSKNGDKTTTGKDALKNVFDKTGDLVIGNILEIRSVGKMLKNDIKHWQPTNRTTFWGEEVNQIDEVFVKDEIKLPDYLEGNYYDDEDDVPF